MAALTADQSAPPPNYLTKWLTIPRDVTTINHMVKQSDDRLDSIFQALSDSTRRGMLARLAKGRLSVTELAAPYDMSLAAISKHLKVLEAASFVKKEKNGRFFICRADLGPLAEVTKVLEELGGFWSDSLNALEKILSDDSSSKKGEKNANK